LFCFIRGDPRESVAAFEFAAAAIAPLLLQLF
jgi:hypothetical protein